jgi:hypothetical protein
MIGLLQSIALGVCLATAQTPAGSLSWTVTDPSGAAIAGATVQLRGAGDGKRGIRYNGVTQLSYLILNPPYFPAVPSPADLQAGAQPQQLQPVYSGIKAPRLYQASIGIERQWNAAARTAVTWIGSRGVHLSC